MNARIPVLLLALSVVALAAPSQAQNPAARSSCNNAVRTILARVDAKYAATTVLTEANHARYKKLHAAVRPNGTMEACMNRRTDLVALEAALAEMIAEPKAGDKLHGGVIVDVAEGGKHGLVAYPTDQPGGLYFDAPRVVGYTKDDAPKTCDSLVGGGFSDWYLPSYEELDRVWKQRAAIGHFRDNWVYWTSGWYGGRARQTVTWASGKWGYLEGGEIKTLPAVRCVRKF